MIKIKKVLAKIKENGDIVGLDDALESHKGFVTYPLYTRLTQFLAAAIPALEDAKQQVASTQKTIGEVTNKYGEVFDPLKEDEPGKSKSKEEEAIKFKFFHLISVFFRKLRNAADDNLKARKKAEVAAKKTTEVKVKEKKKDSDISNKENILAFKKLIPTSRDLKSPATHPTQSMLKTSSTPGSSTQLSSSHLQLTPLQKAMSKAQQRRKRTSSITSTLTTNPPPMLWSPSSIASQSSFICNPLRQLFIDLLSFL